MADEPNGRLPTAQKVPRPRDLFKSAGVSGLTRFTVGGPDSGASGYIYEEWEPLLKGLKGTRTYREMQDSDPVIGGLLFAIEMLIRQVDWYVKPANDTTDAAEIAEFIDSALHDMEISWPDTVSEILSFLPYGWSLHELLYKSRDGLNTDDPVHHSKHDDGKVGWRAFATRGQETLFKWEYDDNDSLIGMTQLGPPDYQFHTVPMKKAMLFRTRTYKGNPEGRALDPQTAIATPDGWRVLDQIQSGDRVFDDRGCIRTVTARQDWEDRPCYRVRFNDGSEIIADANHQWVTQTTKARSEQGPAKVRTTVQIAATIKGSQGTSNHSIPWAEALVYPEQALPVHPYFFGLWLGNGYSRAAQIACHEDDAEAHASMLATCGYTTSMRHNGPEGAKGSVVRVYGAQRWDAHGPQATLRAMDVIQNKHIPEVYLRGSIDQRKALLAGLMDSDGHCDKFGRCEFINTNVGLVEGVAALVRSLGVGAFVSLRHKANGTTWLQDAYVARFTPTWSPFRLVRKTMRIQDTHARRMHYIVSVEPVAARRTVCIEVDSPSHLFLAGTSLIPTHNSILRSAFPSYTASKHIKQIEGIGVERDLAGLPVAYVPPNILFAATPEDQAALTQIKQIITNIRRDEQEGVVWPLAYDQAGNETYKLALLTSGGARQFDTTKIIERYDARIAMTVLADFILLGHEQTGTYALGASKLGVFSLAIAAWLDSIGSQINDVGIPKLVALNGWDQALSPRLEHGDIEKADLAGLGSYLTVLSSIGVLPKDSTLIRHLMEAAELPVPDEATLKQHIEQQQQQAVEAATSKPGTPAGNAGAAKTAQLAQGSRQTRQTTREKRTGATNVAQ